MWRVLSFLAVCACSSSGLQTLEPTELGLDGSAPLTIGPQRKGPYLNAEGDDRGIDVRVRLERLPDDIAAYVLRMRSWSGENVAGSLVPVACDEGRAVRVIPREAFAFDDTDDAWLHVRLEPPEIERGKSYAVVGCMRTKSNVLHPTELGEVVAIRETPTLDLLATPSGPIAWQAVDEGHRLLAYDTTSRRQVVTEILAMDDRPFPAVTIALADGRVIDAPSARSYYAAGAYRPAAELEAGDFLLGEEGPVRVLGVEDADPRSFAVLDVTAPDNYFHDGLLVRDARDSKKTSPLSYAAHHEHGVTLSAAPLSFDCMLTARLSVTSLPDDVRSIAIVASAQPEDPGTRRRMTCSEGTMMKEIDRGILEVVRDSRAGALELWLQGDPIDCNSGYALRACARSQSGRLTPLGDGAVYGKSGFACFAAGTPISTPVGDVPIETLKAGDDVRAYDVASRTLVRARVVRVTTRKGSVMRLTLTNGRQLLVTPEHPFYAPERGWITAAELTEHAQLFSDAHGTVAVVAREDIDEPITVYNLTVSAPHTYFAGGALVHNY